jgi:hypothetical protein
VVHAGSCHAFCQAFLPIHCTAAMPASTLLGIPKAVLGMASQNVALNVHAPVPNTCCRVAIAGSALSPVKTQELQSASRAQSDKYLLPMEYTSSSTESQVPTPATGGSACHGAGMHGRASVITEACRLQTDLLNLQLTLVWIHKGSRSRLQQGDACRHNGGLAVQVLICS